MPTHGGTPPEFAIPPGSQRLEFNFTALSFTVPEAVRFKYKLEGLETDWQDAGTRRTANYTHLPPGNYRFHVIACNNDGVWNETGATMPIVMLPYFWETKWFICLTVMLSLTAVAGAARYIVAHKMQRRLEIAEREGAIERERTRIANDIHDDLGANLTEIALLSELAQNADASPDEVSADIRRITKARDLTRSLDEIVWAVNPQNDNLDNFVTYACNYAENYLRTAKIACRLRVPEQLPNVPLETRLRHNLFLILKEALNNIVKHSSALEVWIQIEIESGTFSISIKDNGRGFLVESNGQSGEVISATATDFKMARSGLDNMRKRVEDVGGRFEFWSSVNRGTEVKLTIPLKYQEN